MAVVGVEEGGREMTIKRTTTFMFAYFTFIILEHVKRIPATMYALFYQQRRGKNLRIDI